MGRERTGKGKWKRGAAGRVSRRGTAEGRGDVVEGSCRTWRLTGVDKREGRRWEGQVVVSGWEDSDFLSQLQSLTYQEILVSMVDNLTQHPYTGTILPNQTFNRHQITSQICLPPICVLIKIDKFFSRHIF